MIPDWVFVAVALALLVVPCAIQVRKANCKIENFRAVEAERIARKNTAPLGNAEIVWDRAKDPA